MKISGAMVLFILIFTLLSCSRQSIESKRFDTQILIDGIGNDWEKYNLKFNKDFNIVFGALNSDSSLYLMFRFNDPGLAHMFALRGMTLWMDKNKQTGLSYKDENLVHFLDRKRNSGQLVNQNYIANGVFNIIKKDTVIRQSIDSFSNLDAAFNFNDGLYCFEFLFPLKNNTFISALSNNGQVNIGIELSEINKEEFRQLKTKRAGSARDSGLLGGRSGGGRKGGMGGRGGKRNGPAPNSQVDFDGKEVWFEVILAK